MPHVRRATIHDLPGAYRVCLLTGDSGKDATALARDPDLLGQIYVGPYIVGEPDLALVVADEYGVAGYCLAASDTRAWEAWARAHWWPELRTHHPLPAAGDSSLDAELIREIHEPPQASAEVVGSYPSHLHIDLLPPFQSGGWGRRLMETAMQSLRDDGSVGLHLGVSAKNTRALGFYEHLGFTELHVNPSIHLLGIRL